MTLDAPSAPEAVAPAPSRRRALLVRLARTGWFAVLAAGLVWALASRWSDVRAQLDALDVGRAALGAGAGLAGVGVSSGIWHAMLRGVGAQLPVRVSLRIFFVGQVGKYLPGAVWPAVTQAALAREHGVTPRTSVAAATLFLWVHLATGSLVALAVLVVAGDLPAVTALAIPPLLAALHPRVTGWCLRTLLTLLRRRPLPRLPDGRAVLTAVGWAALMWMLYGAHVWALTSAAGAPVDPVRTAGVFAASWVVGFVLVIAPAGAGPREVAMVALLPVGGATALVVALASRLVLTVADAAWAALTALDGVRPRRRSRTQRSTAATERPPPPDRGARPGGSGAPRRRSATHDDHTGPAAPRDAPG